MANEKRYYWLKFREDFFSSMRIKKLRKMAGGDTYIIIYLKMQLKALKTGGVLEFKGVEQDFADEIALDIDEEPDNVRIVLSFLMTYGLCECSDNIHYFLPFVEENTGSETASTQRSRAFRERQKALQCNASATEVKRIGNAEKEIEKEIDIEKDNIPPFIPPIQGEQSENEPEVVKPRKKPQRKPFVPPTIDEVRDYACTANLDIDPQAFYDYFTAPDPDGRTWIDSEGKPVRNWKQKMQTWSRKGGRAKPQRKNVADNFQEALRMLDREGE